MREIDLNVRAQMFVLCIGLMRNWELPCRQHNNITVTGQGDDRHQSKHTSLPWLAWALS